MRKSIKSFLIFVFVCFGVFALASCEMPQNPNKDKEEHQHEYVEGKCECGAIDPNEQVHVHKFVEGVCSCGKVDPNYQEHTHEFVNGKCECGESDPDYVPTDDIRDGYNVISIAEAIEIANASGSEKSEEYYIYGKITNISSFLYGSMTIEDETGSIYVYGVYSKDGSIRFDALEEMPAVGDEIVIKGALKTYNGTPEVDRAYLQELKHNEVEIDDTDYVEYKINEVRELEVGTKVKVTGVVAQITYAFGFNPNGIYLVDETGSIYVYGMEVAGVVEIGNEVTLIGSKTYYILEDEKPGAAKFGYKGCCQIEKATVVENDKGNHEFDKSWISESTVKDIVETKVTENITTNIYKVTALIKKVIGTGFTNYYINDLDGYTGSYVYTACSGDDFSWLDEFDGKFCTVYLSPINCKSSSTSCFFRFIPVLVIDEGYELQDADAPSYALKYHVFDQFLSQYEADPETLLISSVSNELHGLDNITIDYKSSDEAIVDFEETTEGIVFHTKEPGFATITVTATYKGYSKSEEIQIEVKEPVEYQTITVKEAIESEDGTQVIVKGVVLSSLVNQDGFYLIDETGVIAVTSTKEQVALLSVGDEVVIEGTKSHKIKEGYTGKGQINIYNSNILVNYYGNHSYSTDLFDTTKDLKYLYGLNVNEDHSTEVYVVEGIIEVVEQTHYSSIKLKSLDGSVSIILYSSSANQYGFLKPYNGQQVTVELAPCNWNSKTYYAGCVISVIVDGVKVMNELNFNE